jgi:hypothetical protein
MAQRKHSFFLPESQYNGLRSQYLISKIKIGFSLMRLPGIIAWCFTGCVFKHPIKGRFGIKSAVVSNRNQCVIFVFWKGTPGFEFFDTVMVNEIEKVFTQSSVQYFRKVFRRNHQFGSQCCKRYFCIEIWFLFIHICQHRMDKIVLFLVE